MSDLSGQTIRGYKIIERIGGGGYGDVYRASQLMPNRETAMREVAVKIIRPEYANNAEFIRRFEAEAQMVARLDHLHIVPLIDYWRDPNSAYLVMRLLRGGSLRTSLEAGAWTPIQTLRLLEQIGAALTFAHRQGVIHRDLKPDNILLDDEGNAYLADFGIAKDLRATGMTQEGSFLASPHYMAPEQIDAANISPQADIYNLGLVIYEALTGEMPYGREKTLTELVKKHLYEALPSVQETNPDLPPGLDAVILRATAKSPQDRYDDAMALVEAFRDVVLGSAPSVVAPREITTQRTEFVASNIITPGLQNPFKGLEAFEQADAAYFFGREDLTRRLLDRLNVAGTGSRFLAVVGPSGSGKSSVVKAGVIPAIRRGALPGSDRWFVLEMDPGAHPLEQLEIKLLRIAVNPPDSLLDQLRSDERGLVRAVGRVLPDDESELLLVIDQFEEIFTMVADEAVRKHFLNSLLAVVQDERSRVRIVITLRADFLDRPLLYADFGPLFREYAELVLPLSTVELREAIVGPAERAGLELDSGLVEEIITDVGDQPGTLPLLQYALTELYERREGNRLTLPAYRESGGVMQALARRAEQIYTELDSAGQEAVRQMFLRLVVISDEGEDTRRRVQRAELTSLAEGDAAAMERVIDIYEHHRLLTFDRDPVTRAPTVEVAHEALIRTWERLRETWLATSRKDIQIQRDLMRQAEKWRTSGRDASYLARGTELSLFEDWSRHTDVALAQDEHAFLQASIAQREAEREAARLEEAYKAELKQRALNRLRLLVGFLLLAVIGAIGLTIFAFDREGQAQNARSTSVANADAAATARFEALVAATQVANEADQRATAAQDAELQAATAIAAQLTSERDRDIRATAQSEALIAATQAANEAYQRATAAQDAELQAATAIAAQSTSERDRDIRATAQAEAQTAADVAATAAARAELAQGRALAAADQALTQAAIAATNESVANAQAAAAATARADALQQALVNDVLRTINRSQPDLALALALAANEGDSPSLEARQVLIEAVSNSWIRQRYSFHSDWVWDVAISPDGHRMLSASRDGSMGLWDVQDGTLLQELIGHTGPVRSVAISPDGRFALSGGDDDTLRWWNLEAGTATYGRVVETFRGHEDDVLTVAISPDGQWAVSGGQDGLIMLWDLRNRRLERTLIGHDDAVNSVSFSPDGTRILSGSADRTLILWEAETGEIVRTLSGHTGAVTSVVMGPHDTAISGGADDLIHVWDLSTGEIIRTLAGHEDSVMRVALSPDGMTLVSSANDDTIIRWDVRTGQQLRTFQGHSGPVSAITFSPDGRHVLTGSYDTTLIMWDIAASDLLQTYSGHLGAVNSVVINPVQPGLALSAADDGTLILWDIASGRILRYFQQQKQVQYTSAAFSPDGQRVASGTQTGDILIWDTATAELVTVISGAHTDAVVMVGYNPEGDLILSAAASSDSNIKLWDSQTYAPILTLQGAENSVAAAAFSPDGNRVVASVIDRDIIIWDTDESSPRFGMPVRTIEDAPAPALAVAYDASGSYILSGHDDTTVILWDAATGEKGRAFEGHSDRVLTVAFGPEGKLLSGAEDGTVILWDIASGYPIRQFIGHQDAVRTIAFDPVSMAVLSGSADRTLKLWSGRSNLEDILYWVQANRELAVIDCAQREQFGITPHCDENGVIPTSAPYPTLTPSAVPPAIAQAAMPEYVDQLLQALPLEAIEVGALWESRDRVLVDLKNQGAVADWNWFGGLHADFVLSSTVSWGQGAAEKECGLLFRQDARDSYYAVLINREGQVRFGPGPLETGTLDLEESLALASYASEDQNYEITLVAVNNRFAVFVNGEYIDRFEDNSLGLGRVALVAYDDPAESTAVTENAGCLFDNTWLADIESPDLVLPAPPPPTFILDQLAAAALTENSGFLADVITDTQVGDTLTNRNDWLEWENFDQVYRNFATGATIGWGPGAEEDECGLTFREVNGDNMYTLRLDREGRLRFRAQIEDIWQSWVPLNGTFVKRGRDDSNALMLVALDDVFSVYLNGVYAGQVRDDRLQSGEIGLLAGTWDESEETYCTFTDSWVWEITADDVAPPDAPTPTPTATAEAGILSVLSELGYGMDSGYVADRIDDLTIDLSGRDNVFEAEEFSGSYANFIASTTIAWGPGDEEDYCGFQLRRSGNGDLYSLKIDRENSLWFTPRIDSEWGDNAYGNGDLIRTGMNDTNTLTVVGIGSTFSVYLNGEYAGQFVDDVLGSGAVALVGATFDESEDSWCRFTDSWVWDLAYAVPRIVPSPTPTGAAATRTPAPTVAASSAITDALTLVGVRSDTGYLAEQIEELVVGEDTLADKDWWNAWESFDEEYTDFVMGATFAWGPGAAEDECGLVFRLADNDNMYTVRMNRESSLRFRSQFADEWDSSVYGNGDYIRTEPDATNNLILVGQGDTFSLYVNGQFSGRYTDTTFTSGKVGMLAVTQENSDATYCSFTNAWVWSLEPAIAAATPTETPVTTATDDVAAVLAWAGLEPDSGELADTIDSLTIDLSDEDNWIQAEFFDGTYGDFVVHATAAWGPGAAEDACAFRFRSESSDNYYIVQIDREGTLMFYPRIGGEWQDGVSGDGSAIRVKADAANTMTLVAQGSAFDFYVNGKLAAQFEDTRISSGLVGLAAATYDESDATHCTFTDAWVWRLSDETRLIVPSPTPSDTQIAVAVGVDDTLEQIGLSNDNGELAATIDSLTIDLSDEDNWIEAEFFDGTYGDFVVHATATWGPGAAEDACAFRFRSESSDNYYVVQIDREGGLMFYPRIGGEWDSGVSGDGSAIRTKDGSSNMITLVVRGNMFDFYVNGELAAQFEDARIASGRVGLAAATYDESEETSCSFSNAWVWQMQP